MEMEPKWFMYTKHFMTAGYAVLCSAHHCYWFHSSNN